jgi:hypothetical protein
MMMHVTIDLDELVSWNVLELTGQISERDVEYTLNVTVEYLPGPRTLTTSSNGVARRHT